MISYRNYIFLIVILIASSISRLEAQDNTNIFLRGVPQRTIMNPALKPTSGWYIAFPALGGVQINGSNSGFSWNDIIRPSGKGDSLMVDLDYVSTQIQDNNFFTTEATLQLLGFGFERGRSFFSLDINHKLKARANYPKALFDLRLGNWNYNGDMPINHDLSDMYVKGIDYTEIALGWSYEINEKVRIGTRIKALLGVAMVESESIDMQFITSQNSLLSLSGNASIRTNLPMDIYYDEDGYVKDVDFTNEFGAEDFLATDNLGFGIDFGGSFQITDKLHVGASLIDIGSITFSTDVTEFSTTGTYSYLGADVSDEIAGDDDDSDDYWDEVEEEFKDAFKVTDSEGDYTTNLMGSFILNADYQLKDWWSIGLLSRNYNINEFFVPEVSIATGFTHKKWLSSVLSYSMKKNAPANIGFGLAFNAGPFQIYGVTDNFDALFNLESAKYINGRIGVNLIFD
ncbi:DUF5723 family protein [Carboxylicivirga marina]|uniref:DUF5723 domain-containing protein n=1 Tax=Carboxylicivirga marina TaxID=2800988 RepID=A0ABS1HJG1_9BACT|nr:DUF5723 family protein [Carboxylicivirga marina]MBK3517797.1 hypothetical protein [Carboxylicivirga marina]